MCRLSPSLGSILLVAVAMTSSYCRAQVLQARPASAISFDGPASAEGNIPRVTPDVPRRHGLEPASAKPNPEDARAQTPATADDPGSLIAAFRVFADQVSPRPSKKQKSEQVNANWLYGAYLPRDVPRRPLTVKERWKLYALQTFLSPGIYAKTAGFALYDHAVDSPTAWGSDAIGFAKRLGNRHAQFVIQNSVSSLGNGLLGWDPRYDRCKCRGFWSRTGHAALRNFVTYGPNEDSHRPQLMPYLGAFAASSLATTWQPENPRWQIRGYQAAITQVFVGVGTNVVAEFGEELGRMFHHR